MRTEEGWDCGQCSISRLGPWRSMSIYILNIQFLCKILLPFPLVTTKWLVNYCYNRQCAANFGASIYSCVINMMDLFCKQIISSIEAPCINADRICSYDMKQFWTSRFFSCLGSISFIVKLIAFSFCWPEFKQHYIFLLNGKRHVQKENWHH